MAIILSTFCFLSSLHSLSLEPVRSATIRTVPPPYVSDLELAQKPTVIVGRWNRTPLTAHDHVEGNVAVELEGRTEILIERVIQGDVKPSEPPAGGGLRGRSGQHGNLTK